MYHYYAQAIEERLFWLGTFTKGLRGSLPLDECDPLDEDDRDVLSAATAILRTGDTYFMNRHFCELADFASRDLGTEACFKPDLFQSQAGWMWLEKPLLLAPSLKVEAVGWQTVPDYEGRPGVDFYLFGQRGKDYGIPFTMSVAFGEDINTFLLRCRQEEVNDSGTFEVPDFPGVKFPTDEVLRHHFVTWLIAAFLLMSQKLTLRISHQLDRPTRKWLSREPVKHEIPSQIQVITLRRLEEDRKRDASGNSVDWQWQWSVRGHWRNQYLRSTGEHKPVFVEAYIKGPENKPLKPPGHRLFAAVQ